MKHLAIIWLFVGSSAFSQSTEGKFESVQYQPAKDAPAFVFSSGNATAADPIRITIRGRKLTNDDRVYRLDLQKYWLSLNVPTGLELRMRTMNECDLKVAGEYPYCDLYSFVDPKSGKLFKFFIYIGNWP